MDSKKPAAAAGQLLFVGEEDALARDLARELGTPPDNLIQLGYHQRESADWQDRRTPGMSIAVVIHRGRAVHETLSWLQTISLSFRPSRLIVVMPTFDLASVLQFSRAGADGIVSGDITTDSIMREVYAESVRASDFFPDPNQWLKSLRRASEELLLTENPGKQMTKLLRLFITQLKMDRASIMLCENEKVHLAAGVNLPQPLTVGTIIKPQPDSITSWVIQNKHSRLVEGRHESTTHESAVRSAICAPLMANGNLLGVVNFSSLKTGRQLTPTDLSAAEVFASLLAMAISNQRLHEQKVQSERLAAVGRTTATVSHCMKNILQILKGSAMMLEQGERGANPGLVHQGAEMMKRATARMDIVLRDLLDYSKHREPNLVQSEARALLDDVAAVYNRELYPNHEIIIRCAIEQPLMLDADRLHRALLNLVSNSIDILPHGGRVLLTAHQQDSAIIFSVSDDGPGVPEKDRESIFEPFYSTKGSKGTGLGLATVMKFCEENGGTAHASECPELGGLLVEMQLPVKG